MRLTKQEKNYLKVKAKPVNASDGNDSQRLRVLSYQVRALSKKKHSNKGHPLNFELTDEP